MLPRYTETESTTSLIRGPCTQVRKHSGGGFTLTIGDITVPVARNLQHPERVTWLLPGSGGNCGNNNNNNNNNNTNNFDLKLSGGNVFFQLQDPTTRSYLRWICQKEQLRQDMCLVGEPGPAMRWLVQMYSYLVRREVQYFSLNRDTTESDLGQRREIRNGTLVYDDQCVVVAAREGQLLLLEGLEKAERNVLPVINNLLENREMHLENGMMLIHPERYDRLLQELLPAKKRRMHDDTNNDRNRKEDVDDAMTVEAAHEGLRRMGFIRVSENFRVVGLTVPVPPYEGNPLDPPLRSRFQCLYVNIPLPSLAATKAMSPHPDSASTASHNHRADEVESLLKLRAIIDEVNASTKDFTIGEAQLSNQGEIGNKSTRSGGGGVATMPGSGLQTIGSYELAVLTRQLQLFPDIPLGEILPRAFPWMLYAQQTSTSGAVHVEEAVRRRCEYERLLDACNIGVPLYEFRHSSLEEDRTDNDDDLHGVLGNVASTRRGSFSRFPPTRRGRGRIGDVVREKVAFRRRFRSNDEGAKGIFPRHPEEFNDVLRIENIRSMEQNRTAVVVGDACIACKNSGGTYRLPIYMGKEATMHARGRKGERTATNEGGTNTVKVVTACCPTPYSVFTPAHYHVLQSMLQLHIAGQHILLLGPTGCGKTTILREFAHLIGSRTETMYLYADMTNKDLFQRRTTDSSTGDTKWETSALVEAALNGHIAVLDGIDKLPHGMLSSIQQLLVDGGTNLFDGTLLKSQREYEILKQKLKATDEEMRVRRIFPVHPAFRVVATARPTSSSSSGSGRSSGGGGKVNPNSWRITHEVTSLFGVILMPATAQTTLRAVLSKMGAKEMEIWRKEIVETITKDGVTGDESAVSDEKLLAELTRDVDRLLHLRDALERLQETEPKIPQLSLRQLLHLIRFRVRYPDDFTPGVESTLLLPLMNTLTAGQVRQVMHSCGFDDVRDPEQAQHYSLRTAESVEEVSEGRRSKRHDVLTELSVSRKASRASTNEITGEKNGNNMFRRVFVVHDKPVLSISRVYSEKEKAIVPYVPHFHSNPLQESIIVWLAKQYAVGNNILLIGNQGVGKNKVVDAFLSRIGVPRQYIQLHRDTTVGSLTINPTVEAGRVIWTDSPLVKAVQCGHCLVVDEIDKAPVEVVQVLKGLVEDHEMRLRDGRQIRGPRAHVMEAENERDNTTDFEGNSNIIDMHPDFRIIVLANPPGFPFHGNDFYRECGDLFASYVMSNPDSLSQLRVLKAYGPSIPDALLVRLIGAFQRLQKSFEEGHLTYPFSLRELIAVVKHMSAFPHDGIYEALNNVFNFDVHNENTLQFVRQVLQLHLNPLISSGGMQHILPLRAGQSVPLHVLSNPLQLPSSSSSSSSIIKSMGDLTSLPVRFLTDADCGGPCAAQSIPTWCAQYGESDFAGVIPSSESNGYTEWSAAPRLPFLRSQDEVLGVITMDIDANTCTPITVSVLFTRVKGTEDDTSIKPKKNTGGVGKRVILAVMALPSVSLGMTAMRRSHLPPGQVKFFDLTRVLPIVSSSSSSAAFAFSLHAFNAEGHDSSLSLITPVDWLKDVFGISNLLAIVDAVSGLVLLVSPFSTVTAVTNLNQVTLQQQEKEKEEREEECDLSVVLPFRVAPPSREALLCFSSVRPLSGIVAMTRPNSAELYVWMKGQRIAVTLPAERIDKMNFFTDNLATLSLRVKETTIYGVLKIAVSSANNGKANASFCPLPDSVAGDVVGFVENQTTALRTDNALLQPLTPPELRGAVIVPTDGGVKNGDVVYMTVDEYSPDKKMWLMRLFADKDAAAAIHSGLMPPRVDHVHQQLLAPGQSGAANHRSSVTAVNFQQHMVRRFASPPIKPATSSSSASSLPDSGKMFFTLDEDAGVALWYDKNTDRLFVADALEERVQHRYRTWSALLDGSVKQVGAVASTPKYPLPMTYSTPRKKPSGDLKHGKEDDGEHHGGNTYAGGTGGTDTAGLGGLVGPYRLDKGRPVHQVSPEEKQRVPPHIIEEAKRMGKAALEERLREIGMSAKEYEQCRALQERVMGPVALLRTVLAGLKVVEGERTWVRGQTDGVWDDSKIVEGIVGERNIYKRRVDSTERNPFQSKHKKRLLFVLDVSASMYRFEGMDHRLTKLLESTVMVMEAFAGFEEKIDYSMVGHNGDSACIELVPFGQPPANQKARMEVCQRMVAYSQYCWSGDNTVEAMRQSIDFVTAEKGDAYLVFVISDANLPRYGIMPSELSEIMTSHREVQMFCIFIASLGEQASNLQAEMPPGHAFECLDTQALPHILKQIFISVNLF